MKKSLLWMSAGIIGASVFIFLITLFATWVKWQGLNDTLTKFILTTIIGIIILMMGLFKKG